MSQPQQPTSPNKMAKVLEQVRNMLAKADHPNTPPAEAEMCRNRAEALMFRYRIDVAMAGPEEQGSENPSWRSIRLVPYDNEFRAFYSALARYALQHVDCEGVGVREWDTETGMYWLTLNAVGFEGDLAFADLLITSVQNAFSRYLEPKYDPQESAQKNAYRLRAGGMTRARIGVALFGPSDTVNEMKGKNRKVTALVKAEGVENGQGSDHLLGRSTDIDTYRNSFAQGFYSTLVSRLRTMSLQRGNEGAVVLAGRKARVLAALWEKYPHLKPTEAKEIGDPQKDCEKCKKASSGFCRDHAWMKPKKAQERAFNWDGYRKGGAAARTVDIGTTTGALPQ